MTQKSKFFILAMIAPAVMWSAPVVAANYFIAIPSTAASATNNKEGHIAITPTAIDFGSIPLGVQSKDFVFYSKKKDGAAIVEGAPVVFGNFELDSSETTCQGQRDIGAGCAIGAKVTPTQEGPLTGQASLSIGGTTYSAQLRASAYNPVKLQAGSVEVPFGSFEYDLHQLLPPHLNNPASPGKTTWVASNLPGWAQLDQNTGIIRGYASEGGPPSTIHVTVRFQALTDTRTYQLTVLVIPYDSVDKLALGGEHVCAIRYNAVECWGNGAHYQLGNRLSQSEVYPTRTRVSDVSHIAAGDKSSCAISDGLALCWGHNGNGQLGTGDRVDLRQPTAIWSGEMGEVYSAHLAVSHSCFNAEEGLFCAGHNGAGQLGVGHNRDEIYPAHVDLPGVVQTVAVAKTHSCASTSMGTWCWGDNAAGGLGTGTTSASNIPMEVSGGLGAVEQIVAGELFSCGLKSGQVYCWGSGMFGQLGQGDTANRSRPVLVPGLSGIVQIAAGRGHVCAQNSASEVFCWGLNGSGQLGIGTVENAARPIKVSGLNDVSSIGAGDRFTCALLKDTTVKCWGLNDSAQLGTQDRVRRDTPAHVANPPPM